MKARFLAYVALAAMCLPAHAVPTLISEGFGDVGALAGGGWVLQNQSTAGGTTGWFQGNVGVFDAQAGAADSYIAANFNNALPGGTIDNWLITPLITVEGQSIASFFVRGADAGFVDTFGFYYALGNTTNTADYSALVTDVVAGGAWTLYSFNLTYASQQLRLAIRYNGPADSSDYIGVDTFDVAPSGTVDVPEPGTLPLLAIGGLVAAATLRRRRALC